MSTKRIPFETVVKQPVVATEPAVESADQDTKTTQTGYEIVRRALTKNQEVTLTPISVVDDAFKAYVPLLTDDARKDLDAYDSQLELVKQEIADYRQSKAVDGKLPSLESLRTDAAYTALVEKRSKLSGGRRSLSSKFGHRSHAKFIPLYITICLSDAMSAFTNAYLTFLKTRQGNDKTVRVNHGDLKAFVESSPEFNYSSLFTEAPFWNLCRESALVSTHNQSAYVNGLLASIKTSTRRISKTGTNKHGKTTNQYDQMYTFHPSFAPVLSMIQSQVETLFVTRVLSSEQVPKTVTVETVNTVAKLFGANVAQLDEHAADFAAGLAASATPDSSEELEKLIRAQNEKHEKKILDLKLRLASAVKREAEEATQTQ